MAKNGLSTFLFAEFDEEKGTYGEVKRLAGAISYKESLTKSTTKVYADNRAVISDSSVTGGTIGLEVDDDDPKVFAPLLGRKTKQINVEGGKEEVYVGNRDDIPVPEGFGFVENERNEKGAYYTVNFYPKVTFSPYDKENSTKKGENEYKTPNVTGELYNIENGDYKYEKRCDSMLKALQVLYALFGRTLPEDIAKKYDPGSSTPNENITADEENNG